MHKSMAKKPSSKAPAVLSLKTAQKHCFGTRLQVSFSAEFMCSSLNGCGGTVQSRTCWDLRDIFTVEHIPVSHTLFFFVRLVFLNHGGIPSRSWSAPCKWSRKMARPSPGFSRRNLRLPIQRCFQGLQWHEQAGHVKPLVKFSQKAATRVFQYMKPHPPLRP